MAIIGKNKEMYHMPCNSCNGETREGTYKEEGLKYPIWVCNKCGDWGDR